MNSPSHSRFQLWPQIILVFLALSVTLSYALISVTWSWFEQPSWGTFDDHLPYILNARWYLVPFTTPSDWHSYLHMLSKYGLQYRFIAHTTTPILFSAFLSFYITKKALWVEGGRQYLVHISGPKLYTEKQAVSHAKKMHKKDLRANKRAKAGIKIHPKITISTSREQTNFAVLGTTGSGKSTVIKPLVDAAIKRGDYALIFDEKKEYTKHFFFKDSTTLLAPWDSRGATWDLYLDITTKQDAFLVASCMIPAENSKEQLWIKGARLIFTGMIIFLIKRRKPWGWPELASLLKKPQEEMLELLHKHFPIASSFIAEGSITTQGFYVNLISELSWLEELALAWPKTGISSFSVKDWVNKSSKKKVVIIQSDSRYNTIAAPMCNAIISMMTRYYLALEDNIDRRTWLFIDEAANLPPNPHIKKWLELARSRGARSVLGTQSISQLKGIYGLNSTDAMLNLLSNIIALRMGAAGDDAKYTADIFSERVVERPSSTDLNTSWKRTKEPIVEAFELTQLEQAGRQGVQGFLFIPGWNSIYKLRWPLYIPPAIAKEHCPAKWLSGSKTTKPFKNKNRLTARRPQC